MEVAVAYFSGSGNTRLVAEELARAIRRQAAQREQVAATTCMSIEELDPRVLGLVDAIVAGFPVYAFHAPLVFRQFVEKLPDGRGKPAFLFCTHGGAPFAAVAVMARRFARRGYNVRGTNSIRMPDTIAVVMARKGSALAQRNPEQQVEMLAAQVVEELIGRERPGPEVKLASAAEELLTGALNAVGRLVLELVLRRGFWVDSSCDLCGICAQRCPNGNITLTGGTVRFETGCETCLRCVNVCPKEAIQIRRWTVGKNRWRNLWGS
ncbi:MAG: EFR1 family ferrodoxin [Bacillota bacterium]